MGPSWDKLLETNLNVCLYEKFTLICIIKIFLYNDILIYDAIAKLADCIHDRCGFDSHMGITSIIFISSSGVEYRYLTRNVLKIGRYLTNKRCLFAYFFSLHTVSFIYFICDRSQRKKSKNRKFLYIIIN